VLATARARPILGLYVVATDKGRPITKGRLERAWRASCAVAGVADAQFRDLRAKYGTEAEEDGQDYQAGLGHASKAMSERYLRKRRTVKAEPLRRKL
jgi:integrase